MEEGFHSALFRGLWPSACQQWAPWRCRAALWGAALEGRRGLTDTEGVARTAIVWETQREWREAEVERLRPGHPSPATG